MPFDAYMAFQIKSGSPGESGESQAHIDGGDTLASKSGAADLALKDGAIFEIDDFSFDIEQTLNIGSQSSGAGAGKVKFNPFKITRKTDRLSPKLYMMCCAGQHFAQVTLCLRRAGGATTGDTQSSGTTFLRFDFAMVAVATISWSGADGDESPKEEVTFGYGALQVSYQQQGADGGAQGAALVAAWNQVKNNNNYALIKAT